MLRGVVMDQHLSIGHPHTAAVAKLSPKCTARNEDCETRFRDTTHAENRPLRAWSHRCLTTEVFETLTPNSPTMLARPHCADEDVLFQAHVTRVQ